MANESSYRQTSIQFPGAASKTYRELQAFQAQGVETISNNFITTPLTSAATGGTVGSGTVSQASLKLTQVASFTVSSASVPNEHALQTSGFDPDAVYIVSTIPISGGAGVGGTVLYSVLGGAIDGSNGLYTTVVTDVFGAVGKQVTVRVKVWRLDAT